MGITESKAHRLCSEGDAIFREFDLNHDGLINKDEFTKAVAKFGIECTEMEINAMFTAADKNRDGFIDMSEFKDLVKQCPDLSRLTEAFRQFDLDGDGHIVEDELKKVLRFLGQKLTDNEMSHLFKRYDTNRDGKIDFQEFSFMMKARPINVSMQAIFQKFDTNSDGYITEGEFNAACQTLGLPISESEMRNLFNAADTNHDMKISFEEFAAAMNKRSG